MLAMRSLTIVILTLVSITAALGQTAVKNEITAEMRQDANKLYQSAEWEKAAVIYAKIVTVEPENAGANYRLGMSYLNLNRSADAVIHLDKAFSTSPNPVFAFALARAYSRAGNKIKTYDIIDRSTKLGGISPESLTTEKDLAAWQTDAEFKELVRRSDLAVNPCKASPEFRQFDFWIGEWDVKNPQGVPSGTSSIQLILGQCIILENWTSGAGSSGKSFNIYDVNDKKWHQTYVDDKGTFSHYIGGIENGSMVITANTSAAGKSSLARMTFSKLPNGDVRQHGENSTDNGKTWTTSFDLTYSRKKT